MSNLLNELGNPIVYELKNESIKNTSKKSGVYALFNHNMTKVYIGSTNFLILRIKSHASLLRRGKHDNSHLQRSFNKNSTIYYSIIEELEDESTRIELEQFYINKISKLGVEFLFNMRLEVTSLGPKVNKELNKIISFDINGKFVKEFDSIRQASQELNINYELIRSCCRGYQTKTNNYIFFFSKDTERINKFIENPYYFLQDKRGKINKGGDKKSNSVVGKKWSEDTILKNKDSRFFDFFIEAYNFSDRKFIGIFKSIRSASKKLGISNLILRKHTHKDEFVYDNFIIRITKIRRGILPKNYYYRPLQPGLYISVDNKNDEMFVYTKLYIKKDSNLGKTHVLFCDNLIRVEIGGFINNNNINPNCKLIKISDEHLTSVFLISLRDIEAGEELTIDYNKCFSVLKMDCKLNFE